jgi:GT2 family glycosyltransferase
MLLISLVLYNNDESILKKLLASICSYTRPYVLFVVDNSPTSSLSSLFNNKNCKYFHNPSNPGFGASHNLGIKYSIEINSEFHIVINPDIYFENNTLENILEYMSDNLEIGQLMPKILSPDGTIQYLCKKNPTIFDLFVRGFMPNFIKKLLKKRINKYDYRNFDYNNEINDIPYLSGCFMVFRTNILKKVGFFDENIFMYLEDADITRRFLQISRTVYYPRVIVYHYYAGLTHKMWKFKWITIKSAITYFNKWGWLNSII